MPCIVREVPEVDSKEKDGKKAEKEGTAAAYWAFFVIENALGVAS